MKIGLYSHLYHFCWLLKKKFTLWFHFLLFCLVFCLLCFVVFKLIYSIAKSNAFLKRYLWEFCAKNNSFNVFRIKISFSLKICNHFFDRFASFSVFNENFGFEQNTNQILWSQINAMILGQICVYQLGNWWNPSIRIFFKTLPCY